VLQKWSGPEKRRFQGVTKKDLGELDEAQGSLERKNPQEGETAAKEKKGEVRGSLPIIQSLAK